MHPQAPGPGWWQAPDGRWYPPQQPMQQMAPPQPGMGWGPPPQPVAPARSGNRGCLIAVVVVVVLVLAGAGIAAYFVAQAANKIGSIADGGIIGGGIIGDSTKACLPAADISAALGSRVREPLGGTIVGTSGCAYLAVDQQGGIDVNIVSAPALIADDQFKDFTNEGTAAKATSRSIQVGDRGSAWASQVKSAAIAEGHGRVVLVEIMATGQSSLGDRTDVAIGLLRRAIA